MSRLSGVSHREVSRLSGPLKKTLKQESCTAVQALLRRSREVRWGNVSHSLPILILFYSVIIITIKLEQANSSSSSTSIFLCFPLIDSLTFGVSNNSNNKPNLTDSQNCLPSGFSRMFFFPCSSRHKWELLIQNDRCIQDVSVVWQVAAEVPHLLSQEWLGKEPLLSK